MLVKQDQIECPPRVVREGWLTNSFEEATSSHSAGLSTSSAEYINDATLLTHPINSIDRTVMVGTHHVLRGPRELYTEVLAKFKHVFYVYFVIVVNGSPRHGQYLSQRC